MIRLIVFAVIGLVIGLGGGSGVAVMRAKRPASSASDTTAAAKDLTAGAAVTHGDAKAEPAADDSAGHATPAPSAVATVPDSTVRAEQPPAVKPESTPVARSAAADTTHAPPAAATAPGRIVKIFAAMPARDAARVLEQLDDADVQTVLTGLNDRQAAAILAGFPPARAAAISRAVIRGKKGTS